MTEPIVQAPSMTPAEGDCFRRHVRLLAPGLHYLEIGVYIGGTMCTAAWETRDHDCLLYGVDPLNPNVVGALQSLSRLDIHPLLALFHHLRKLGDGFTRRMRLIPVSSEVLIDDAAFREAVAGRIGFLTIDGEHVTGIYNDIRYLEFLPLGGLTAIHDYNPAKCPNVCWVVDRLLEDGAIEQVERVDKLVIGRKVKNEIPRIEQPEHLAKRGG